MHDFSPSDIDIALRRLGRKRVLRAQKKSAGSPLLARYGIGGAYLLALGMRETSLRNIEGGAKLVNGVWLREDDPDRMDVGCFQISRRYHKEHLALLPGVKSGTWAPKVPGKTAADGGYVPTFLDGLLLTIREMEDNIAELSAAGVPESKIRPAAIAAHNAGVGGTLSGLRAGNVDRYTTGGDYSAWVIRHRKLVREWLLEHTAWRIA